MMPEEVRDTSYDPADEVDGYPWDCDLTYPIDVADDEDDDEE